MLNFHKPSIDDYGWIHDILYPANLPGADNTFHNMYFWECYYGEVGLAEGFVTQHLTQDGCPRTVFRPIFIRREMATCGPPWRRSCRTQSSAEKNSACAA